MLDRSRRNVDGESLASTRMMQTADKVEVNLSEKKTEMLEARAWLEMGRNSRQRDGLSVIRAGEADEFSMSTKRNTCKNRTRTSVATTNSRRKKFDGLTEVQEESEETEVNSVAEVQES